MVRATTWMSRLSFLFMAGCLLTLASPAGAATYVKFYDGGTGYNGPFNGANTVYANTAGSTTDCPDGHAGCGAGDVVDTSLTFLGGTITATATTGATATKAWDDTSPDWGGLGAGPGAPSDADQIAFGASDVLTLTFNTQVVLLGVGTLFADAHTPFGAFANGAAIGSAESSSPGSLVFSLNGSNVSFLTANSELLSVKGSVFTFAAVQGNPDFYVSALKFAACGNGFDCDPGLQTPLPGALPLFATGLGALGLLGWRRKRKKASLAA